MCDGQVHFEMFAGSMTEVGGKIKQAARDAAFDSTCGPLVNHLLQRAQTNGKDRYRRLRPFLIGVQCAKQSRGTDPQHDRGLRSDRFDVMDVVKKSGRLVEKIAGAGDPNDRFVAGPAALQKKE